jgi:hypothetical protein
MLSFTIEILNSKELVTYLELIKFCIAQAKSELEILEGGEFVGVPCPMDDASREEIERGLDLHKYIHHLYKMNDAIGKKISDYYEILD